MTIAKLAGQASPAEVGNYVSGTLVGAANLGSGKFAMIDDGLGFSLVPWQPMLEQRLERQVTGVAMPDGGIDWTFGRSRGLVPSDASLACKIDRSRARSPGASLR
jgi:Protein of unknown function (DUF3363)